MEQESQNIEPYDGRDYLTEAQYDRQDWLDECAETIDVQKDWLGDIIDVLESIY